MHRKKNLFLYKFFSFERIEFNQPVAYYNIKPVVISVLCIIFVLYTERYARVIRFELRNNITYNSSVGQNKQTNLTCKRCRKIKHIYFSFFYFLFCRFYRTKKTLPVCVQTQTILCSVKQFESKFTFKHFYRN